MFSFLITNAKPNVVNQYDNNKKSLISIEENNIQKQKEEILEIRRDVSLKLNKINFRKKLRLPLWFCLLIFFAILVFRTLIKRK
jgi:hypothetical protein